MSAFVHLELGTDDPKGASDFYKKLFGWKLQDMPMPDGSTYTTFSTPAGGPGGGIGGKMNPQQPTAWLPYIGVKSVKATVEKARSLGANVIVDYMPVMEMGALGIFVDPTGATIGLWEAKNPPPAPAKKKAPAKKAAKKKAPAKKAAKKAGKKKR